MDFGFIILTGLLTSFHCVAMCGTMVATYAIKDSSESEGTGKGGFDAAPHIAYHSARLVSYMLVGLILGAVGSALNLGGVRGTASLLAGGFMVLLGLNMLNVHPIFRVFSLRMPKFVQRAMFKDRGEEANRFATPLIFGLMTGLMPCGPLQAMELYAAGTGAALKGAATMLVFGIMTVPMMLAFGAATQMLGHTFKKRIMTVGAVVVMGLGVVMLNRGLMLAGSPVTLKTMQTTVASSLGFAPSSTGAGAAKETGGVQEATIVIQNTQYRPDTVALKVGVPVRLTIDRRESGACSDFFVIPAQGVNVALKPNAKTVVEFTPKSAGNIPFTCGMGMMSGTFIVNAEGQAVASGGGAAGGGSNAGAAAGSGGLQGISSQASAANWMLLAMVVAMAGTVGYRKWAVLRAAKVAEAAASARKSGARGGRAAHPPRQQSARGRAAEPERPWWMRESVWIAGALLVAVMAGYTLGSLKARSGQSPADIASGQPAGQTQGYDPSQFSPAPQSGGTQTTEKAKLAADKKSQSLRLVVAGGYQPSTFTIKAGVPTKLSIERHEQNACSKYLVFPDYNVQLTLPDDGVLKVDVPPLKAGRYRFQCGMNMLSGTMVVE